MIGASPRKLSDIGMEGISNLSDADLVAWLRDADRFSQLQKSLMQAGISKDFNTARQIESELQKFGSKFGNQNALYAGSVMARGSGLGTPLDPGQGHSWVDRTLNDFGGSGNIDYGNLNLGAVREALNKHNKSYLSGGLANSFLNKIGPLAIGALGAGALGGAFKANVLGKGLFSKAAGGGLSSPAASVTAQGGKGLLSGLSHLGKGTAVAGQTGGAVPFLGSTAASALPGSATAALPAAVAGGSTPTTGAVLKGAGQVASGANAANNILNKGGSALPSLGNLFSDSVEGITSAVTGAQNLDFYRELLAYMQGQVNAPVDNPYNAAVDAAAYDFGDTYFGEDGQFSPLADYYLRAARRHGARHGGTEFGQGVNMDEFNRLMFAHGVPSALQHQGNVINSFQAFQNPSNAALSNIPNIASGVATATGERNTGIGSAVRTGVDWAKWASNWANNNKQGS